jgi:hypothetical protein
LQSPLAVLWMQEQCELFLLRLFGVWFLYSSRMLSNITKGEA